jgi:Tfp pilus assembly protein PilZ
MKTRKYLRVPLPIKVKLKILEKDENFNITFIEDIGWGGVLILTDADVKLEDRIIMQVGLAEENVSLELWGTIVRVRKAVDNIPAGIGIEFDPLDEDSRSLIQQIISEEIKYISAS